MGRRTSSCQPSGSDCSATSNSHTQIVRSNSGGGRRCSVKQNIRQLVWNSHIGADYGSALCFCCGATQITPFNFECGHVVARAKGGKDSVTNLRPICGLCNRSMATMNMIEFQKHHQLPVKKYHLYRKVYFYLGSLMVVMPTTFLFYYLYWLNYLNYFNTTGFFTVSDAWLEKISSLSTKMIAW